MEKMSTVFAGSLIAETFSMIYVEEMGNSCGAVGHAEVRNAVTLVAAKLAPYRNCLVAIDLPKHPALLSALLGVLETRNVFVCCSEEAATEYRSARVSCIISSTGEENEKSPLVIHGLSLFFRDKGHYSLDAYGVDKLCYLITTSGTLGQRKEVLVPYSCIMPNIQDFSRRFRIGASDVILFATATTFDPFVVEILLAVVNGAKILIVPDSFRSIPSKLVDAITEHGATFMQMTPSQLKILPHSALVEIFAGRTCVRTIILGGEAFPMNFLRGYHINDKVVEFYNVYGITEVSCWASCHKINWKETQVEIGEPLLETKLEVSEYDELLIGGSRRCFINGELSGVWIYTGDIVERTESGEIYWCDRRDDQQKINGVKVSLSKLARKAEAFDGVHSALALRRGQSILLFVHTENSVLQSELSENLSPVGLSLIVITVDSWPITRNGKVDRKKLMQIFEQRSLVFTMKDLNSLLRNLGISLDNDRETTFRVLGLTSLHAAELTIRTEHLLKKRDFPLMQYLLSDTGTIAGFLDMLSFDKSSHGASATHVREFVIKPAENSMEVSLEWEYDMRKCIDAAPVLGDGSIFLGSHSGRFVSLSLDGVKNWEVTLGGRIEATACFQNGIVAVGCYDGCLYFMDAKSGQMIWVYCSDDAIKSIPVLTDDGTKCLFGSHDKCLYMLDVKEQKMLWKVACDGSILSSPLLNSNSSVVLCATLQGEFLAVELKEGKMLWKRRFAAPIFADLCAVGLDRVLVVVVRGMVALCNVKDGNMVHQYDVKECVFAAPVLLPSNSNRCIVVTQSSSLFLFETDTVQLLQHVRIEGAGSFPRAPHILLEGRVVFIQDSSGLLLAVEGIQDFQAKSAETEDFEGSALKVTVVLKVLGETFGGVRIIECDQVGSSSGSGVRQYRALIGSRDDRIRCFCFSL